MSCGTRHVVVRVTVLPARSAAVAVIVCAAMLDAEIVAKMVAEAFDGAAKPFLVLSVFIVASPMGECAGVECERRVGLVSGCKPRAPRSLARSFS
jgi:hypothetical protein